MMVSAIGSTGLRPALDALRSGAAKAAAVKADVAKQSSGAQPTAVDEIVSQGAPIDTSKVDAIKAALAAGTYRIDPQAIARTMIAADLPELA